tara:strand:- start:60255 stop:60941 length:687 start_codon:yes stop_codon:yes gene_type:complete
MRELRKRNLRFILLDHDAVLPSHDMIWFGSEHEVARCHDEGQPIAVTTETIESAVDEGVRLQRGIVDVIELCFGVDPGPRPGIAWLADGVVLGVSQLEFIEDVAQHIKTIAERIQCRSWRVRIGNGAPLIRDQIINDCLTNSMHVEQVNEAKTSRGLLRHNHVVSAIRIALIRGSEVTEFREITPTDGDIREIQRQSRKRSNGRKTISSQQAYEVAIGQVSMDEALNE